MITDLTFEKIEPRPWGETPAIVYARKNDHMVAYRISFIYNGHKGVMISAVDKALLNDPHIDLRDFFRGEIKEIALANPPPPTPPHQSA